MPFDSFFDGGPIGDTPDRGNRTIEIPEKLVFLLTEPWDFKAAYGGRGGAKSWNFARALILKSLQTKHLILCAREYQNSIDDSVMRTIVQMIRLMDLEDYFHIQAKTITCKTTGSEFIFRGLRMNIGSIKSTEGITICWVEEAQRVSRESWRELIPTIREKNAEIWASFNPLDPRDATSQLFIENPSQHTKAVKIGWQDNPWFNAKLNRDRLHMMETDPDAYEHVWEGGYLQNSDAVIFKNRYTIKPFEAPENVQRFFFGADFGFALDPSVLLRGYIHDEALFIDHEAFGQHVELDDMPALYAGGFDRKNKKRYLGIPGSKDWPIKADSARPETISYLRSKDFNIMAAEKWPGSVEDGIAHLKTFKHIYIHDRCQNMGQEARLYSYKVDKLSGDVLPIIVDKHNHGWDSARYMLDGYIQRRGAVGTWAKLAQQTALARMQRGEV